VKTKSINASFYASTLSLKKIRPFDWSVLSRQIAAHDIGMFKILHPYNCTR